MPELIHEDIDRLVKAATAVRENAHAPYSQFMVGAAVLDGDGRVHVGCNVENASYGLSVCAERHAIAAAASSGSRGVEALVVVTDTSPPTPPCGACRQVLVEFGDFPVILENLEGERIETRVEELLPNAFTPDSLTPRGE
jgi:cytidine deaminase